MISNALFRNQEHMARLSNLQFQASTGLRYQRGSDAPVAMSEINLLQQSVNGLAAELNQMGRASGPLNASVSQLVDINTLLTRARQIALEAPQSNGLTDRHALASEVESLLERALAIANATDGGLYLYSGTTTSTEPIHVLQDGGLAIAHVSYRGSRQAAALGISQSIAIDTRYAGSDIFFTRRRTETLMFGDTGLAVAAGTDSEIGRANLVLRHTDTAYQAGSGVAAGTDSGNGDTILGQGVHQLALVDTSGDGSSGTVSLNGGPAVTWTATDSNLLVTGTDGEQVYIDTTSITAGFNGSVSIVANGTVSADGGASEIAIDFSNNQVISNSLTGGVTHVDTSGVRRVGVNQVEYTGTADLFTSLLELKDDLLNRRGLDDNQLAAAFERRLRDIERASDRVLDVVGLQSVDLKNLQELEVHNETLQLEMQRRITELGAADMPSVIVEMQQMQTVMQFNFASISIVQNNNILDFLG